MRLTNTTKAKMLEEFVKGVFVARIGDLQARLKTAVEEKLRAPEEVMAALRACEQATDTKIINAISVGHLRFEDSSVVEKLTVYRTVFGRFVDFCPIDRILHVDGCIMRKGEKPIVKIADFPDLLAEAEALSTEMQRAVEDVEVVLASVNTVQALQKFTNVFDSCLPEKAKKQMLVPTESITRLDALSPRKNDDKKDK